MKERQDRGVGGRYGGRYSACFGELRPPTRSAKPHSYGLFWESGDEGDATSQQTEIYG